MASPSQAPRKKAKAPESGRDAIMDVAEQLFAERGLEAVSLRTVNGEAGYSVAALHYHFGTREGLVQALLTRSQPPMLERRERMLAALRASREPPPLERIVEALVMPLAQSVLEDPERGSRAMRFLARL
jgi:AcrR family transcriptional regulator